MKIVVCWPDISGYMAACWRALSALPGVQLFVIAYATPSQNAAIAFSGETLAGIQHRLLDDTERKDLSVVTKLVLERSPDVIITPGWLSPTYVALTSVPELRHVHFAMGMDTGWRGDLRQHLSRYKLRGYLKRVSSVFVAGERAWQYAKRLGVPEDAIFRGVYGCDYDHFATAMPARRAMPHWPRRFLYTGRYADEKRIDVLLAAYARYRETSSDPWPLTCAGRGPLEASVAAAPGVTNAGFVQPKDQPSLFAEHGALLLLSSYEPWGVVIAEAMASGLPVVCTEACGAGVELVRSRYNGLKIATNSIGAAADAMAWVESQHGELSVMGERAQVFAGAHDAKVWAQNAYAALSR